MFFVLILSVIVRAWSNMRESVYVFVLLSVGVCVGGKVLSLERAIYCSLV